MKVALCFIISYEHILNKEEIWKKWIEYNKDIINVYFYYKDIDKITSPWIKKHCIPPHHIYKTTYYHVIPAYISIMKYALQHDSGNTWFCMLTDACCPIISPTRFKYLFYKYHNKSIFNWKKAWWNPDFHKRANLRLLPEEFRLANDPWFVLKREDVSACLQYCKTKQPIMKTICDGGLANESLFAVILYSCQKLLNNQVICSPSHATDWSKMSTSTSPHVFTSANQPDLAFIEKTLKENEYTMFIRKIAPEFPDDILKSYIYKYSKEKDNKLVIRDPFVMKRIIHGLIYTGPFLFYYIFMVSLFFYIMYNVDKINYS